ncbi:hypothetical protein CYY_007874 [Polysphondylium violaceum]|uniref:ER membrane protein complex subunit 7 beta-sandwich domain-containing protein n=1 Tax=Polysphondylium violaceum TaxID=133409 RepID=A0A8J4PQ43_9MYCE|nr:hypothetical protein CYY_007874 [Polysphondylium violaceum]
MKDTGLYCLVLVLCICIVNGQSTTATASKSTAASKVNKLEGKLAGVNDIKYHLTKVNLIDNTNYNEYSVIPDKAGSFAFYNISSGFYTMEIECFQYIFYQYKVDVLNNKIKNQIKVRPAENETIIMPQPLVLKPMSRGLYFQQHVPFNIFSLFQNPMVISIGFTSVMIYLLPKMSSFVNEAAQEEGMVKPKQGPELLQKVPDWGQALITN